MSEEPWVKKVRGLGPGSVIGVGIGVKEGEVEKVTLSNRMGEIVDMWEVGLKWLQDAVELPQTTTVIHNSKYYMPLLRSIDVKPMHYTDTLLMAHILNLPLDLRILAYKLLDWNTLGNTWDQADLSASATLGVYRVMRVRVAHLMLEKKWEGVQWREGEVLVRWTGEMKKVEGERGYKSLHPLWKTVRQEALF